MIGGDVRGFKWSGMGRVGLRALKAFGRERAHFVGPFLVFPKVEGGNPTGLEPKANAALGAAEPEEEETPRGAVRADGHQMAAEDPLDPGVAPRLQVQAQSWAPWCVGQNPQQAPRGLRLFSVRL